MIAGRSQRRWMERLAIAFCAACASIAVILLVGVLVVVFGKGISAISWQFLFAPMRNSGLEGGIVYHLVGTAILITTALLVAIPLAASFALVHEMYVPKNRLRSALDNLLYLLNGMPSILFGIVGFFVFVKGFGWGKSWLAGGLVLALMMLPTLTVAMVERIRQIPRAQIDAAHGLGLRREQVVWSIIVPQSCGGLLTGALLGLARAAGETAPILFTAAVFSGATLPSAIRDSPVLALPYHIFVMAQDSLSAEAGPRLWATAAVLLIAVFLFSALSLPLRMKLRNRSLQS